MPFFLRVRNVSKIREENQQTGIEFIYYKCYTNHRQFETILT